MAKQLTTNNCDIDRAAVNVLLMEMLEDIITDKIEGALADKTEEYLVRLVAPILYAIDTVTTTGDVQTLESESGDSTLGGAAGEASAAEGVEMTVSSHGGGMPSGDQDTTVRRRNNKHNKFRNYNRKRRFRNNRNIL